MRRRSGRAAHGPTDLKGEAVPTPQIPATRWRFLDSPAQTVAYLHQLRSAALGAMLAQLRAADIVIAIERYRRAHDGALPASIDLLVPQFVARVPIDPFSGSAVLLGERRSGRSRLQHRRQLSRR